ncbi:putative mitochondrial hypothetical protein [Leptomonas pyrrhocoris]|uniref:Uncharacterized protein n=1 Tax=Leptomonas pyrrhocoris TaxID=157538 RepID=A0A0M9G7Z1_LEPPY|nr:putative mitochondrial hypothetical protein [Leptomonas pyrrhocoris]XP_015662729.1 putative mitochondrial hypothetical protein [Leptomonas pyrrhocoris]KPA84289.1 putative mitochondrial hypothetical protein [Leptomonas pyrrhocoris]KPA84290.1 putative mitochondrial hypothetical protein [Leptomonas pyrrhocoris]|eukprot:XP_015662728.1 putative mitochondrial hypothetical protein [Leptomonas pyrrhocoris]
MMRRRCVGRASLAVASSNFSPFLSTGGGGGGRPPSTGSTSCAVCTPTRAQSSRGHGGSKSGDGSRLHTFISDNRSATSSFPASSVGSRRGNRGGGGAAFVSPTAAAGSTASSSAATMSDWATQLQRELMSPVDPLGGLAHRDYYRDPASGYAPQYAPRDFVHGGRIAYPHTQPGSSQAYAAAAAQRDWLRHDVESMRFASQEARATARQLRSGAERECFTQRHVPADRFQSALPSSASVSAVDLLRSSGALSDEKVRQQATLDRYRAATAAKSGTGSDVSYTSGNGMNSEELLNTVVEEVATANDDLLDEQLRIEHGLREKERFDFNVVKRSARLPFEGYDMDRRVAQQAGRPQGAQQLPPTVPPSSMEEAMKNLRGGSDTLPDVEAQARLTYASNTTTEEPKLGEALTRDVVNNVHAQRQSAQNTKAQTRKQRFGLGRQGALVQDGGPDKRTLRKHANDERLVDAVLFASNAYRRTVTDEHVDPYLRRSTAKGVGHLLNNRFDMQRREDRVARGQQDLTERNTVHYGVPIQQSVDEFVVSHRNARGERPLDYFKPFPHFRAQRLQRMYRDVEGFSLMKQRPEAYEWELFTRYRAHHQQRRELALLHGLEPVANETAEERAVRRVKLDEICENTPFDPTKLQLNDDEVEVDVETLRSWFGVYVLPSPTIVEAVVRESDSALSLHLHHTHDELKTLDKREHVLSSRYLNRLLLFEGFQHRWNRGFTHEVFGKAPEPVIKYAQPPEVLQYFDAEEQAMYQQYVKEESVAQMEEWAKITRGRRYIAEKRQYGEVVGQGMKVSVVDARHAETGGVLTLTVDAYGKALNRVARADGSGEESAADAHTVVRIDGQPYTAVPGSERAVTPLSVRLESGESMEMTDEAFSRYPLEVPASATYNHALNYGIGEYSYNRGNYVETQDVIWEEATAGAVEGWSPATHADGLRPGLPVRARRRLATGAAATQQVDVVAAAADVSGDFQRGRIVEYLRQPFFNPDPRLVTVAFHADGVVQQVPLADVLIWQRRYHGPERTTGDESRRYNPAGLRRYIDAADPKNEKAAHGSASGGADGEDHFLEKYERRLPDTAVNNRYRTTKQITELDQWNRFDTTRPENYRPLSISHRRDYIRQGYMHRYTPWEWIAIQEADQPIIYETMRQDNVGASYFFSLNRAWRYKARPHGYLRNYENEVRDMLQFVDGVTPWKQAQKIRTYWEVRQHHPMPQFNRPEVAMHRNSAGLLPSHMWDTDKKTGKVKGVKDSVRDYQTKTPLPKWVQL